MKKKNLFFFCNDTTQLLHKSLKNKMNNTDIQDSMFVNKNVQAHGCELVVNLRWWKFAV